MHKKFTGIICKKIIFVPVICTAVASLLVSCGGPMVSTYDISGGTGAKLISGVPYYLPLAKIPVTIAAGAAATTSSSATGSNANAGGAQPPATPAAGKNTAATPAAGKAAASSPVSITINNSPQTTASATAGGTTPAPHAGGDASTPYSFAVTVGAPVFIPDTSKLLFLQLNKSAEDDNTFSLHVDSNGLLSTSTAEAVDQTSAIVTTLAQIASTLAVPVPAGPSSESRAFKPQKPSSPMPKTCNLPKLNMQVDFIPRVNDAAFGPVVGRGYGNHTLADPTGTSDQSIDVSVTGEQLSFPASDIALAGKRYDPGGKPANDGVIFRTGRTWKITISTKVSGSAETVCNIHSSSYSEMVFIPNGGIEFGEDMSRAALVDKKVNLTIANGMLMGVDISQPSQVLKAVQLPLTIVETIVKGATSAIQPLIPASNPASVSAASALASPSSGLSTATP